jgi:hypothetical protein
MLGTRDFEREAQGSTQECNTACQTKMTDCILDCDGVLSCELACKAAAVACVRKCTDGGASSPDLDAGVKGFAPPRTDASDGARDDASDAARIDRARVGSRDH